MDTAVETRRGIIVTVLKNHIMSFIVCFLLVIFAFKWLYASSIGIVALFTLTTVFYMSGIYSYSYEQTKIDLRNKGKYDFLMPLKIGGAASLAIFTVAGIHILLVYTNTFLANEFAPYARLWNYPFFYFFYGADGWYLNIPAIILISIIPIFVSYLSYLLSIKKFSFLEKLNNIIYKKN